VRPAADGRITVELAGRVSEIIILDISGRIVRKVPVNEQPVINLELDLPPGLYLMLSAGEPEPVIQKLNIF
jgi:hypothetical protein